MIGARLWGLVRSGGVVLAVGLIGLLALPVMALLASATSADLAAAAQHPMFAPALILSVRTTVMSLIVTVVMGTPLAWWFANSRTRTARAAELVVDLAIVLPPAVVGVALLYAFGRHGALGGMLSEVGIALPFTEAAVVLAQIVVSAPFFVQAASNAFRKVDSDLMTVARTLGASPLRAFFGVAVPVALPGLIAGASLAWARALGEFGATLLFAGNLSGTTQTMPLAIFTALETDVRVALLFSLVLVATAALLLVGLRALPHAWDRARA